MTAQARTVLVAAVAAVIAFAIGAAWQYSSARVFKERLDIAEHDLAFQRLEATLGAATIEAQRGSYEIARQLASQFFTGLQSDYPEAPAERQPALQDVLAGRDAMITALSRSDPQSGSLLAQLFTRYRIALGEPVGPESGTSSPTPPPTPPVTPPATSTGS
jgi:hypothetical protein